MNDLVLLVVLALADGEMLADESILSALFRAGQPKCRNYNFAFLPLNRALEEAEEMGLITSENGRYSITEDGRNRTRNHPRVRRIRIALKKAKEKKLRNDSMTIFLRRQITKLFSRRRPRTNIG